MKNVRKLKYPLTILLIVVLVIYVVLLYKNLNDNKYVNINSEEDLLIEKVEVEAKEKIDEKLCSIDIKGAINKPGVYQVNCSYTVNDVIKLAGGKTKEADTSVINLAKKVTDEMVIIIYTKEEVKNSNIVDTVIKVVEKECVCPNIQNDGCINDKIEEEIGGTSLVNINTASLEELQGLSGIGESKAKAIIKYREENGNFNNIEDLLNVDGIGTNLYEQIKAYITT